MAVSRLGNLSRGLSYVDLLEGFSSHVLDVIDMAFNVVDLPVFTADIFDRAFHLTALLNFGTRSSSRNCKCVLKKNEREKIERHHCRGVT